MSTLPDLTESIKKAALQAIDAGKPMSVAFGTVKSEAPLLISIEQKLALTARQLILSRHLTDYEIEATVGWTTGAAGEDAHAHAISGKKTLTVHGALKAGERVILLRLPGGQKYLVWDRMVM